MLFIYSVRCILKQLVAIKVAKQNPAHCLDLQWIIHLRCLGRLDCLQADCQLDRHWSSPHTRDASSVLFLNSSPAQKTIKWMWLAHRIAYSANLSPDYGISWKPFWRLSHFTVHLDAVLLVILAVERRHQRQWRYQWTGRRVSENNII